MTARISLARMASLFCISVCMASPVLAANESASRQKRFEKDKAHALSSFNDSQQNACIKAFRARYQSEYTLSDGLAFNEPWSMGAYDKLFWKGKGKMPRGVIFTGAVTDKSGIQAGNLICYYAMTDNRLDFQSAYVLPAHAQKRKLASRESALATFASRE